MIHTIPTIFSLNEYISNISLHYTKSLHFVYDSLSLILLLHTWHWSTLKITYSNKHKKDKYSTYSIDDLHTFIIKMP
jgi:hypothetical protein